MSNQAEIQIRVRKYSQQYAYFREDKLFINTLLHILNIFFYYVFKSLLETGLRLRKTESISRAGMSTN